MRESLKQLFCAKLTPLIEGFTSLLIGQKLGFLFDLLGQLHSQGTTFTTTTTFKEGFFSAQKKEIPHRTAVSLLSISCHSFYADNVPKIWSIL